MRLDSKLNFLFPVDGSNGVIHVCSAPLSRSVFEMYYAELGAVFTKCFDGNDPKHIALTAPQLALPALKKASRDMNTWEGLDGVKTGFINELIRLTMIAHSTEQGWQQLPLDVAITRGLIDEDTQAEILSNLVFFHAISKVAPKSLAGAFLEMAASLRNWQFSSSGFMEFIASLQTLKEDKPMTKKKSSVAV